MVYYSNQKGNRYGSRDSRAQMGAGGRGRNAPRIEDDYDEVQLTGRVLRKGAGTGGNGRGYAPAGKPIGKGPSSVDDTDLNAMGYTAADAEEANKYQRRIQQNNEDVLKKQKETSKIAKKNFAKTRVVEARSILDERGYYDVKVSSPAMRSNAAGQMLLPAGRGSTAYDTPGVTVLSDRGSEYNNTDLNQEGYTSADAEKAYQYELRIKENNRDVLNKQDKTARLAAKNRAKTRTVEARSLLDKAGYYDVRVRSTDQRPAAPAASYNSRAAPKQRVTVINGQTYGYAPIRSQGREIPVPMTKQGYVQRSYLREINNGRPADVRARDYAKPAARVYPAKVTPKQAGSWIANPGRSDIQGIDTPMGTRPTVYASPNVPPYRKPQYNVRSANNAKIEDFSKKDDEKVPYMTKANLLPYEKIGARYSGVPHETYDGPKGHGKMIIPVTPSGRVPHDYLVEVNEARPERSRKLDSSRLSAKVLNPNPTPYQAKRWIADPTHYDIPGVDAKKVGEEYTKADGSTIKVEVNVNVPPTEAAFKEQQRKYGKQGAAAKKKKAKANAQQSKQNGAKVQKKAPASSKPKNNVKKAQPAKDATKVAPRSTPKSEGLAGSTNKRAKKNGRKA